MDSLQEIIRQCKTRDFASMHMNAALKQMAPRLLMYATQDTYNPGSEYLNCFYKEKKLVGRYSSIGSMYSLVSLVDLVQTYTLAKEALGDDRVAETISNFIKLHVDVLGVLLDDPDIPKEFKDECISYLPFLEEKQRRALPPYMLKEDDWTPKR